MGGGPPHLTQASDVGGDAYELREGNAHSTPHPSATQHSYYKPGDASLHP